MKIRITKEFRGKLRKQINYISKDKPTAARNFKDQLLARVKEISDYPYSSRKSIYFDNEDVRDLIFKGYTITY